MDAHSLGEAGYHPERPERLVAARRGARAARVRWTEVPARPAKREELVRVHDEALLDSLERLRGEHGFLDADTYFGPRSVDAALLAAGGVVAMVDAMIDGQAPRGVALVRPPGHHARPSEAMGFCLLNNVAVAAAHALSRGLSRVLVMDWDVHHGNGTQEAFWERPDVLYMSTHQFPFYPGTGAAEEDGEGEGRAFTVNVPLGAGGGDDVYRGAFERVLLPIAEEYAPELVLVSAGFDAAAKDPLANMRLDPDAFAWMARALARVADKSAGGRIAMVLEGGYDLASLEHCLRAAVEGMVNGDAAEIARAPDHPDVQRSARAAHRGWSRVG